MKLFNLIKIKKTHKRSLLSINQQDSKQKGHKITLSGTRKQKNRAITQKNTKNSKNHKQKPPERAKKQHNTLF